MSKALELLKSNKSVTDRAENFATAIKRNIQRDVIDALISQKEKIDDQLFELTDFALTTNLNNGVKQMTKDECEARFKKIIDFEFQLTMLNLEIKVKTESFNKYFGEDASK